MPPSKVELFLCKNMITKEKKRLHPTKWHHLPNRRHLFLSEWPCKGKILKPPWCTIIDREAEIYVPWGIFGPWSPDFPLRISLQALLWSCSCLCSSQCQGKVVSSCKPAKHECYTSADYPTQIVHSSLDGTEDMGYFTLATFGAWLGFQAEPRVWTSCSSDRFVIHPHPPDYYSV